MLIHKLRSSAVVMCGLVLMGVGALVTAQQTWGNGRAISARAATAEAKGKTATLRLQGIAAYDPANVHFVRVPVAGRVEKVFVDVGSVIRPGDPLLEISGAELAAAKGDYELAVIQWEHDRKVLEYKAPMARQNTLPKKELIEVENAEAQSRLKRKLARDRLLVYGLTDKEIEAARNEEGPEKARMIVRAHAEGVVVRHDVVPGNFYDMKDVLMTIAATDPLWVGGLLIGRDAAEVRAGQAVKVFFPHSAPGEAVDARIDFIEESEPEKRKARFRVRIPNPEGRFKAGGLLRLEVDTAGRSDAAEAPPTPDGPATAPTERRGAPERRPDPVAGADGEGATLPAILRRLEALERKVDRLLERRNEGSP